MDIIVTIAKALPVKAMRFFLLFIPVWINTSAAIADIRADDGFPGSQPMVRHDGQQAPIIDIAAPNDHGVSHNRFTHFDVGRAGAILNNSLVSTQTQLGGEIAGNANLSGNQASIIVNEINSTLPSQLNGAIEVAGQSAQVVIANPSGITCDGCGFINAHHAVLTTGQPRIENGRLVGYDVDRGHIEITGQGMENTKTDYTEIIAHSVKINAGLWARKLSIVAGRQQAAADMPDDERLDETQTAAPRFAIDVASLGGMYAGKIALVGTEHGVGVRNAGAIGASVGAFTINMHGQIDNQGKMSGNEIDFNAASFANHGSLYSDGHARITASGHIDNSGTITSRDNLTLNSASFIGATGSSLTAGFRSQEEQQGKGTLELNIDDHVQLRGRTRVAGRIDIIGDGVNVSQGELAGKSISLIARKEDITTRNANLSARCELKLKSRRKINNDNGHLASKTLTLSTPVLSNRYGEIIQSGNIFKAKIDEIDNFHGRIIHKGNGLMKISTRNLNGEYGEMISQSPLVIHGDDLKLDHGLIETYNLNIKSKNLSTVSADIQHTGLGVMKLDVKQALDNQHGKLSSKGGMVIYAHSFDNSKGKVITENDCEVNLPYAQPLLNHKGEIRSNKNLTLGCPGGIDNSYGVLQSLLKLNGSDKGSLLDNRNGLIIASEELLLNNSGINNTHGSINGKKIRLSLKKEGLNNHYGVITSQGDITITSHGGIVSNDFGKIAADHNLSIKTPDMKITNRQTQPAGGLNGSNSLSLKCGSLENQQGQLRSNHAIVIASGALNNSDGLIFTGINPMLPDSMTLSSQPPTAGHQNPSETNPYILLTGGSIENINGRLECVGDLNINTHGKKLDNSQGIIFSLKMLKLHTDNLINRNGNIQSNGSIKAIANDAIIDNSFGHFCSGKKISLYANLLNNSEGIISSGGLLQLGDDRDENNLNLLNQGGDISSGKQLSIKVKEINGSGKITSYGDIGLVIASQKFINQNDIRAQNDFGLYVHGDIDNACQLFAGRQLSLQSDHLHNLKHASLVAPTMRLRVNKQLRNNGLINGDLLQIQADEQIYNGQGRIYGNHLALQTVALSNEKEENQGAVIAARNRMTIGAHLINNDKPGLIYSDGPLMIGDRLNQRYEPYGQALSLNNLGTIESASAMSLDIKQIDNKKSNYSFDQEGNQTVIHYDVGQIFAGGDLFLSSRSESSGGAALLAGGNIYYPSPEVVSDYLAYCASLDATAQPLSDRQDASLGSSPSATSQSSASNGSLSELLDYPPVLPNNGLFRLSAGDHRPTLIETDPEFISPQQFLGTDYLLRQFPPPCRETRRFADGYYERRMLRYQSAYEDVKQAAIIRNNDTDQFKALMDTGAAMARQHNFVTGVAPTERQLTQTAEPLEFVWPVQYEISLPDGSWRNVLVPQLFLSSPPVPGNSGQ